eukprot:scpid98331/ scgid9190/ 
MEVDERLRWLESRIASSLSPDAEDLAWILTNGETRNVFLDFLHSEEYRNLYVYRDNGGSLCVSVDVPGRLRSKAVVFSKLQQTGVVSKEGISDELTFCDLSADPLADLGQVTRQIFMPMLLKDYRSRLGAHAGTDVQTRRREAPAISAKGRHQGMMVPPL